MGIKPITNKQIVSSPNVNRGKQTSTKDIKNKSGNNRQSITPGIDITKGYSVTLKDIDTAILSHVKKVMRPTVKEANERIDVTVMYGNEERWKSVRKRGVMRDKNGSLILPLIMLKRTDISKNELSSQSFEHDVKREYIEVIRGSKWSEKNRYDRFSVLTGQKPQYETLVTGMPDFTDITYEFVLWTNFIEQMNPLVEMFIEQSNKYWGSSEQYKFLSILDSITDASEMNQDGERFIKSTFNLKVSSYLLSEEINSVVTNKTSNLTKKLTPSRVVFGSELVGGERTFPGVETAGEGSKGGGAPPPAPD